MELAGIWAWKWKSERVIIVQSVVLQRVQLVTGAKNILAWIEFQLNFWNCGAFDKLKNNMHTVATGYLGRACRIQKKEQHYRTFSNFFLGEKLTEIVRYI